MSSRFSFQTHWRKALVSLPRLVPDAALRFTNPEGPQPFVFKIQSRGDHLIPIYVFVPEQAPGIREKATLPVLVDFHGGGFILGSCLEQAPFCAMMARELNCIAISVDYRLGPYDQFPAANEDAEDVISAVLDDETPAFQQLRIAINTYLLEAHRPHVNLDTDRIAISGFSSGGNLALNMAISVEDDPTIAAPWPSVIPPSHEHAVPLLLFYPSLDCRMLPSERVRPAGLEVPKGFLTRLKLEDELMPQYLPAEKRAHPRASPGLADIKDLHAKAKIMLVLPELDSLSALSDVWVEKVKSDGRADDLFVDVVPGVLHGWTQFPDLWLSEEDKRSKVAVFERAKEFLKTHWI
ncbi:MAG: hypothetical protein M1818_004821 [Claussenomyces sp. TS43310]|nr:MAG: hypothetical protein M1818_004821 [Claussenomyces sp. TS43310]